MLFLAILATTTAIAALVGRRRASWRDHARRGLAAAMAFAGFSHLAQPDPFIQHLPDWVPAAGALVAVTGLIEIAIGAALVSRRLPRETVGRVDRGLSSSPCSRPTSTWPSPTSTSRASRVVYSSGSGCPCRRCSSPGRSGARAPKPPRNAPPNDLGHPCSASESHARSDPWNPRLCCRPSPSCHSSPSSPADGRCSGSSPSATARWASSANASSGPGTPTRVSCSYWPSPTSHTSTAPGSARERNGPSDPILLAGVLAQSGGFFLHLGIGREGHRSIGTAMTRVGGLLIAVPLVALAVELIRV